MHENGTEYASNFGRILSECELQTHAIPVSQDVDTSTYDAVMKVLHPALRHIWFEARFKQVPVYDPQGNITAYWHN